MRTRSHHSRRRHLRSDVVRRRAQGAAALVIVTEWEQFRALDLDRLKQVMAEKPAIIDLRNIYLPDEMRQRGFVYESVGRPRPVSH